MTEQEKYTYYRAHKVEDWVSSQMYEAVFDHITEWFGIEETSDLTEEQMEEIVDFRENVLSEYSPLQYGYSDIIAGWENDMWEKEQEEKS